MVDATDERERLSWEQFGEASRELAREILEDGFVPEVVVAIARGGLLPAGAIAYALGVKNCGALNVEFYTGIGTVLDAPEVLPPALDIAYLDGRRVLLVDDVADSGRTLALAVALLRDRGADVRSVTVYTKPARSRRPTTRGARRRCGSTSPGRGRARCGDPPRRSRRCAGAEGA